MNNTIEKVPMSEINKMAETYSSTSGTMKAFKKIMAYAFGANIISMDRFEDYWAVRFDLGCREIFMTAPYTFCLESFSDECVVAEIIYNILHERAVPDRESGGAGKEDFENKGVIRDCEMVSRAQGRPDGRTFWSVNAGGELTAAWDVDSDAEVIRPGIGAQDDGYTISASDGFGATVLYTGGTGVTGQTGPTGSDGITGCSIVYDEFGEPMPY